MDKINETNINLDRRIISLKGSKIKLERIIKNLNDAGRNWIIINDDCCLTMEELNFALIKVEEELEEVELKKTRNSMLTCKHLFITVLWPKIGEYFDEEIACVKCGFDTRMRRSNIPIGEITDEVYQSNMTGINSNVYCNNLTLAQQIYQQIKSGNPKIADENIIPIFDESLLKAKQKIKSQYD